MNEETMKIIWGIAAVLSFAIPFIVLPIVLVYGARRKIGTAKAKANIEPQAGSTQKEPSQPSKPMSKRRAVFAFIVISLAVIVWGVATGLVTGIFSQLIPIVFLYVVVMAISSGRFIADIVPRVKIRTLSQLVFLSLLSAVSMYGTHHYCRYLGFQLQASLEIFDGLSEATDEENMRVTKAFVDYALEEETGRSGFLGYILLQAREGVSIGRFYRSNSINLGSAFTWLYWVMEFGVILGATVHKGRKLIGMAFCESCGNWYGREKHLGGTTSANEAFLLDLVRQKDFTGLGKLIEKNAEVPSLELYFQGCEVCGESQSQLLVRHAFPNTKGGLQFSDVSKTTLQSTESALLLSQFSTS